VFQRGIDRLPINKWARIVWLVFLIVGWAGGASANDSQPPADGKGQRAAERIDLWYVTLRNRDGSNSAGATYGGLRGQPRMGTCALEFIPIPGLEDIAASAPFYIPDEHQQLHRVDELASDRFWSEIDAFAGDPSARIVFYIHGYNVGFEKSCRRAAIFQRFSLPRHRLLLFSWPADGNLLAYTRDEADLMWSLPDIADTLLELSKRFGAERLDVVAHSLGARGVVMALEKIACRHPIAPLVNQLILVAPDVDTDIFRTVWPKLRHLAGHTTLYASGNDEALRASRQAHGYPRLGEAGEYLALLAGVDTIDVSRVGKRQFSGHIYHLYHSEVAADLKALLDTGHPAGRRANLQPAESAGLGYWRLMPKVLQNGDKPAEQAMIH